MTKKPGDRVRGVVAGPATITFDRLRDSFSEVSDVSTAAAKRIRDVGKAIRDAYQMPPEAFGERVRKTAERMEEDVFYGQQVSTPLERAREPARWDVSYPLDEPRPYREIECNDPTTLGRRKRAAVFTGAGPPPLEQVWSSRLFRYDRDDKRSVVVGIEVGGPVPEDYTYQIEIDEYALHQARYPRDVLLDAVSTCVRRLPEELQPIVMEQIRRAGVDAVMRPGHERDYYGHNLRSARRPERPRAPGVAKPLPVKVLARIRKPRPIVRRRGGRIIRARAA